MKQIQATEHYTCEVSDGSFIDEGEHIDLVSDATRDHERNTAAINSNTHQFITRTGTTWRAAVEAETNP